MENIVKERDHYKEKCEQWEAWMRKILNIYDGLGIQGFLCGGIRNWDDIKKRYPWPGCEEER